jgi:hypothetical protein
MGSSSNSPSAQTIARPDPFFAALLGPARRVEEKTKNRSQKSGAEEAHGASSAGIPRGHHVCTREQRTRPNEAPFHRPAGRGKGGGLGVGSSVLLSVAKPGSQGCQGLLAGGCPAATHFLLRRKEKVSKEKATRWSGSPALRSGATCGAHRKRGRARTRLRLKRSPGLIRFRLRSSAQPDGWGKPMRGQKSGVLEAQSASRTGIPTNGHGCTRAQRTRPNEVPLHRPAGRGRG